MSVGFFILGVFAEKGEPGYPFQVLALPSSGCGLSTSIPHANRKTRTFLVIKRNYLHNLNKPDRFLKPVGFDVNKHFSFNLSFRPKGEITLETPQSKSPIFAESRV